MAPVQQKFTVIPDLATGRSNGSDTPAGPASKPPMTMKQAKKLYKAANKGPKLSKAEQRRQDLFEQDRIRKEFEKEKNQARAKASRDKRKEKEEKEKAAKRKKGLPLVSVHPSQDTLARFIRPQPNSKSQDKPKPKSPSIALEEEDSDSTLPVESDTERPSKRRKTISPTPEEQPSEKQDPDLAKPSQSNKRRITSSPAPAPGLAKGDVERPFKRQKSRSPARKEEALWKQAPSPAKLPRLAKQQRSSSPARKQEEVHRTPEPVVLNPPQPPSPKQHVAPPSQPTIQVPDSMGQTADYDADAEEILNLFAQQMANESFSGDDFLLAGSPLAQLKHEAPVPAPNAPRPLQSPRSGPPQSRTAGGATATNGPDTNTRASATTRQPRQDKTPLVADSLSVGQVSKPKAIGSKEPTQTKARPHPDIARKASREDFQNAPVPKPRDTSARPPVSAKKPQHPAAKPSQTSQSTKHASASSNATSRTPLHDVPPNQAPYTKPGNGRESAIQKPLDRTQTDSKTPQPVFRKPDPPMSASKASGGPQTPSMGPPSVLPRFKTPTYQTSGLSRNMPKFLPKAPTPQQDRPAEANLPENSTHSKETIAPSCTQLFLSGLDDFFPSPSQELEEILDHSSSTHQWSPASRNPQPAPPPRPMPPPKTNMIRKSPSTSRNLEKKRPPRRNTLCIAQPQAPPIVPAVPRCAPAAPVAPAASKASANQPNQDDLLPPFSTQDFFFSSQDIRELEEGILSPVKPQIPPVEPVIKPTLAPSYPSGNSTSALSMPLVGGERSPARESERRPSPHDSDIAVSVAPACRDSQDPWLNLSSQQSKSSLPETPTGPRAGAKARPFNTPLARKSQQLGRVAEEGDLTPSRHDCDVDTLRAEGTSKDGSPPQRQPNLSSHSASPRKSLDAPHPPPSPFFTSSGTKAMTLLTIYRSELTLREDEWARRARANEEAARQRFLEVRREMKAAKREEKARLAKLAKEEEDKLTEEETAWLAREEAARLAKEEDEARVAREEASRLALLEQQDGTAKAAPQGRSAKDDLEGSELEDDGIDQLLLESVLDDGLMLGDAAPNEPPRNKSSPSRASTKKASPPNIFSTRKPAGNDGTPRGRSGGSFEKMMALVQKTNRRSPEQAGRNITPRESAKNQAPPMASQETDYGDDEWDACDLEGFL